MAFEPVFEKQTLASVKRLCVHQAVVEARLLSRGGVLISKVLSIATDCTVTPSEVFSGEARYQGRVSFKVIFIDAEGKNHSMDYNADFTDKLLSEGVSAGLKPLLSAVILDTDIVTVDERELKLACVVEVALDAVVSEDVNALIKGGENVYTHDDRVDFLRLVADNSVSFTETLDISELKSGKILLSEARAVTTDRRKGLDGVIVEGKIICDLTCEDEEGSIYSIHRVMSFLEEIPAPDIREGGFMFATCILNSHSVTVETDGEKNTAALEFVLTGFIRVLTDDLFHPIVDAFSVTNELKSIGQSLTICKNKYNGSFEDRVEGAVTLDINMPIADSILAVTGAKLNIASASATSDGHVTYDGIVSANIIYYSAETNVKSSVAVELPFSFTTAMDAVIGDTVTARGCVTNLATKILRGNEIQIKADIEVEVLISGSETKYIMTDLILGEERVLQTAAFSVHVAKGGETLWDVAKALGMTPEIVLTQNPGLSLPLAGGERVMAYRQMRK